MSKKQKKAKQRKNAEQKLIIKINKLIKNGPSISTFSTMGILSALQTVYASRMYDLSEQDPPEE